MRWPAQPAHADLTAFEADLVHAGTRKGVAKPAHRMRGTSLPIRAMVMPNSQKNFEQGLPSGFMCMRMHASCVVLLHVQD